MLSRGLLVVDPHGQEFLLVPEERRGSAGYTLSVLQLSQGHWVRLQPRSSRLLRESMLGALLEFFGNLCRILNHGDDRAARIARIAPKSSRLTLNQQSGMSATQTKQPRQRPGKTASKQLHTLNPPERSP